MNEDAWLLLGALVGGGVPLILVAVFRMVVKVVHPSESLLVLRFGRVVAQHDAPGPKVVPDSIFPWVETRLVSRRIRAALVRDVQVHDASGSEVHVDVLVEYAVNDPVRFSYAIEDADKALEHVVSHAALAVLGSRPVMDIVRDSGEVGRTIAREVQGETASWGLEVHQILLRSVRPSPRAMEQVLGEISARLERAKAKIEEEGRQAVALLHARTSEAIAVDVAAARSAHVRAIGRAYAAIGSVPPVAQAWRQLHDLAQIRPAQTVAFRGFSADGPRVGELLLADGPTAQPESTA